MSKFDPEALRAAAESHRQKTAMGSSATDQLAPNGSQVVEAERNQSRPVDLRTRYMGLWLRNPVVASAGPLSQTVDGIKSLAAGGVGAVVMYSLFEEQIRHEAARETALAEQGTESFAEALSYFPTAPSNDSGLTRTYLELIEKAKVELRAEKIKFDEGMQVGGMIEIPAAALSLGMFIRRLAFLSIGTNDLIQYALAIDRSDEAVVHLYDPLHPAVLKLISGTIATGARLGVPVSVCGEMAGDPEYTLLLLGMGLRSFSMHPGNILEIKQQILRADLSELAPKVQRILKMDEPARVRDAAQRLGA